MENILIKDLFAPLLTVYAIAFMFLCSKLGGWSRLAKKHRFRGRYKMKLRAFQWAQMGLVGYRHILWIGVSGDGLYMSTGPLFIFRSFHPPLLIPWTAIGSVNFQKYFWIRTVKLKILSKPDVKIWLPLSALDEGRQYWEHLVVDPSDVI